MIIGITGGVGTGKSTVLQYLKDRYGAYLIQLDEIARQLQQPGEECYVPMLKLFDLESFPEILNEDGTFNRSVIAKIIFADEGMRSALNGIVHPAVKRHALELIEACRNESHRDGFHRNDSCMNDSNRDDSRTDNSRMNDSNRDDPLIVIEAALLLEDHYDEICDEIWFVYARESVRRERLKKNRGYTDEKITSMFSSQRSDESYRACCDLMIDNSSENIENTFRQLDEAMDARGILGHDSS